MQQQELPAAGGTSAGAGPPAANLNALNLQNGNFVAQTDVLMLCNDMHYYANDYEAFIEAMELVLEVWDKVLALVAWKARTFKKVVITRSVSWDTGINIYEEDTDSE